MNTINEILNKKGKEKITMITAYDYYTAKQVDEAGIDMILVGDSLGMVVLGYDSTIKVTMEDMIHHAKAVNRGNENAFLVVDMPYLSYNVDMTESLKNAGRLIKETGAQAVKLEGGKRSVETIKRIVELEIPVIGHLGLTPQSVNAMGGYKVQGKEEIQANEILEDAKLLEKAGISCLVLEGIPENLAKIITKELSIPTIGIGAGKDVDGQVLVYYDMLGYSEWVPKFVKKYGNTKENHINAIKQYIDEVKKEIFPEKENIYKAQSKIK